MKDKGVNSHRVSTKRATIIIHSHVYFSAISSPALTVSWLLLLQDTWETTKQTSFSLMSTVQGKCCNYCVYGTKIGGGQDTSNRVYCQKTTTTKTDKSMQEQVD